MIISLSFPQAWRSQSASVSAGRPNKQRLFATLLLALLRLCLDLIKSLRRTLRLFHHWDRFVEATWGLSLTLSLLHSVSVCLLSLLGSVITCVLVLLFLFLFFASLLNVAFFVFQSLFSAFESWSRFGFLPAKRHLCHCVLLGDTLIPIGHRKRASY